MPEERSSSIRPIGEISPPPKGGTAFAGQHFTLEGQPQYHPADYIAPKPIEQQVISTVVKEQAKVEMKPIDLIGVKVEDLTKGLTLVPVDNKLMGWTPAQPKIVLPPPTTEIITTTKEVPFGVERTPTGDISKIIVGKGFEDFVGQRVSYGGKEIPIVGDGTLQQIVGKLDVTLTQTLTTPPSLADITLALEKQGYVVVGITPDKQLIFLPRGQFVARQFQLEQERQAVARYFKAVEFAKTPVGFWTGVVGSGLGFGIISKGVEGVITGKSRIDIAKDIQAVHFEGVRLAVEQPELFTLQAGFTAGTFAVASLLPLKIVAPLFTGISAVDVVRGQKTTAQFGAEMITAVGLGLGAKATVGFGRILIRDITSLPLPKIGEFTGRILPYERVLQVGQMKSDFRPSVMKSFVDFERGIKYTGREATFEMQKPQLLLQKYGFFGRLKEEVMLQPLTKITGKARVVVEFKPQEYAEVTSGYQLKQVKTFGYEKALGQVGDEFRTMFKPKEEVKFVESIEKARVDLTKGGQDIELPKFKPPELPPLEPPKKAPKIFTAEDILGKPKEDTGIVLDVGKGQQQLLKLDEKLKLKTEQKLDLKLEQKQAVELKLDQIQLQKQAQKMQSLRIGVIQKIGLKEETLQRQGLGLMLLERQMLRQQQLQELKLGQLQLQKFGLTQRMAFGQPQLLLQSQPSLQAQQQAQTYPPIQILKMREPLLGTFGMREERVRRRIRIRKEKMPEIRTRIKITPRADPLSVTITEAQQLVRGLSIKALHPKVTAKIEKEFRVSLGRGGLRFPTAQMIRGLKGGFKNLFRFKKIRL